MRATSSTRHFLSGHDLLFYIGLFVVLVNDKTAYFIDSEHPFL